MAFNSSVTITGNLTRDPKIMGEGSKTRALLGIAVNEPRRDSEDKTSFFNATVFGEGIAKNIANSLSKGSRVIIKGSLETYPKEAAVDGDEVTFQLPTILVDDIGADLRWATVDIHRQGASKKSAPTPADDVEEDEDEVEETKPAAKTRRKPAAKAKAKAAEPEDEDDLF